MKAFCAQARVLSAAAADILPGETLDVLVYACTAASVVLGNDNRGRTHERGQARRTVRDAEFRRLSMLSMLWAQRRSVF